MEDFKNEVIRIYDLYLMETEKRGISYGEIAYIENLESDELMNLWSELYQYFGDEENEAK